MLSSQTSTIVSTTLPDPDTKAGRDVVLYDGNCNACALAARRLHQMDLGSGRLAFMSLHDARVGQRYPDLSFDDLMAQMYVIDRAGNRHGGADAVRYLTRRLPLMWPLMPLLHTPGTAKWWRRLYRVVARNRYWISSRFFGTKNGCESGACEIHHR